MNIKRDETHLMSILLLCRASLRAAVKEFQQVDARDGIRQKFVYQDGKTYELTIKELPNEKSKSQASQP